MPLTKHIGHAGSRGRFYTDRATERKALALLVPHTMLVAEESDQSSAKPARRPQ
jgi:hypothetical protein